MKFYSLNGKSPSVSFKDALIRGLAPDKGLYFPEKIKKLSDDFIKNIENHSNEEIAYECINQFVGQHTKATDLMLGNWWININGKGDYNAEHDHQNAILSAVYYVEVNDPNTGDLVIHRDDSSRYYLGKYKKPSTNFSAQSFIIAPETSKLIIFP